MSYVGHKRTDKYKEWSKDVNKHRTCKTTVIAYYSFMQVPQGDAGSPLLLLKVGQHQVAAGVGNSCCVEAQQWCFILQCVEVFLWNHAEDIKVMSKIGAHRHLQNKAVECIRQ